jgi:hypothetical protein
MSNTTRDPPKDDAFDLEEQRRRLALILFGPDDARAAEKVRRLAEMVFGADMADTTGASVAGTVQELARLSEIFGEARAILRSEGVREAAPELLAFVDKADCHTLLRRYEALASSASERLSAQQRQAPKLGNRRVPGMRGEPGGRLMCAVAVSEALRAKAGRRPGESNPTAQEACTLLWSLAAGRVTGRMEDGIPADTGRNWRRFLATAAAPAPKGQAPGTPFSRALFETKQKSFSAVLLVARRRVQLALHPEPEDVPPAA